MVSTQPRGALAARRMAPPRLLTAKAAPRTATLRLLTAKAAPPMAVRQPPIGQASNASGTGATALGATAQATADSAIAVGNNAAATFTNFAAIGTGAATTRINQVAIGTGTNTYTLAGINSAASLAAQTGTLRVVTTDAAGNLASAAFPTGGGGGPDLSGSVGTLMSEVGTLQNQVKQAFEGTAIAIALGGDTLPADKRFAIHQLGQFPRRERNELVRAFPRRQLHRFECRIRRRLRAGWGWHARRRDLRVVTAAHNVE